MYCKQNQKINQVKKCTLVVGIDIGSTTHYARAFDWRGIELGNVFKFSNSLEGFQSLSGWMQRIMKKTKKSEVMVGIEPTVITGLTLVLTLRMVAFCWLW